MCRAVIIRILNPGLVDQCPGIGIIQIRLCCRNGIVLFCLIEAKVNICSHGQSFQQVGGAGLILALFLQNAVPVPVSVSSINPAGISQDVLMHHGAVRFRRQAIGIIILGCIKDSAGIGSVVKQV